MKGSKEKREKEDVSARTSFKLDRSAVQKLNHIALVERRKRDEILGAAIDQLIEAWERQNGKISS